MFFAPMDMKKLFLPLLLLFAACTSTPETEDHANTSAQEAPASVSVQDPRKGDPIIDSLNRAINDNPSSANLLALRAERFMEINNLSYAKADIQQAMSMDSNQAAVQRANGEYHFRINQTRVSRNAWEKCIRLEPKGVDCRIKLAQLYTVVGEHRKSAQLVNEVLEIDPNNARAYFIKGLNVRDLTQDTLQAISYFQRAVDLDNTYIDALDMLGVLYAKKKNPLAISYYQNILSLDPNRADVYYKMGVFYMDIKETNKALEAYTKAVELNPKDVDSYFNLGYMHLDMKLYGEAAKYFSKSIAVNNYNYRALYGRAYAYEMMGDITNARTDYEAVLSIRPNYPPALEGLGRVNKQY